MIDERQEELAAMHAFGLLEGEELERFLLELEHNAELRKRARELRAASTSLAHVAPEATPPAELKQRILASAAARVRVATEEEISPPASEPATVTPFPAWVGWLAAACIAIAALWAERQYVTVKADYATLGEQQRLAVINLEQTRQQLAQAQQRLAESNRQVEVLGKQLREHDDLARFKIATLASMLGNSPSVLAVAVWDPAREQGVLAVSKLPAAAPGKDYQLWLVDAQYPTPVSAGTFAVDPSTGEAHVVFRGDKPVSSIAKFAVSLERKGGVPVREGPIVLLSN